MRKASKESRIQDLRVTQQQITQFRQNMGKAALTPLNIIGADPDYDYFWFAATVANQINAGRLEDAALRNYEPVKIADMPQMALSLHSITRDVKTPTSDFISREGLVLHRRLKVWGEEEEKIRVQLNKRLEAQIAMAAGFVGDSKARVFENSSSKEYIDVEDEDQDR